MNEDTRAPNPASQDDAQGDARLRWQLRGLRRELPPQRDLWQGIAARITATPAISAPRKARQRWAPVALAASLLLALGLAWQLRPLPGATGMPELLATQSPVHRPVPRLLDREADAMAREYGAAFSELRATTPAFSAATPEAAALRELDRSAMQIRAALARDPDARFLLERLRRTYAQRLALAQRATLT